MMEPQIAPVGKGGKVNIEKLYQKKSQLEHILLRPDTYIGSVEKLTETMWVCEQKPSEIEGAPVQWRMVQREISYVPGLYKIFDEILVNAAGECFYFFALCDPDLSQGVIH